MSQTSRIHIVGINQDGLAGLTEQARRLIDEADLLVGDPQVLHLIPRSDVKRFLIDSDLEPLAAYLADPAQRHIVVLAAGDPLFYGVAHYLFDRLGKDRFEVLPHVSTMQLAFARVKESWEDAFLTDLNFFELTDVLETIRRVNKVGLFASGSLPPHRIAQILLDARINGFTVYVCEHLGSPNERVTHIELAELAKMDELVDLEFASLTVMILIRKPDAVRRPHEAPARRLFGNPDEAFEQSATKREAMTPAEIRSMVLAELNLESASVVWDVCAGSGSVSIEAARIAHEGTVYAIEMDPEEHERIAANTRRFETANVVPVLGKAPGAWADLPAADAIFLGETGQDVSSLAEAAVERLRRGGRLVAALGSIDNLSATHRVLQRLDPNARVWMVNLARGNYQLDRIRFESLNPVFLISAVKATERE
ncbi:MAG TPA: cobalamin biosynthesis bifunctional protein CbiET [Planctomycetaceae bacterium]|nr:cobalamin biosynthesis bifunctional protein CbiET [Planctomycetaceae bacterium]